MAEEPASLDRRRFAQHLASAAVVSAGGAAAFVSTSESQAVQNGPAVDEGKAPKTTADCVVQAVRLQYPEQLTPERIEAIRRDAELHTLRSRILGQFPLTPQLEPGPIFAARRYEHPPE